MYTCPVCEYTKLEVPPENHEICPSCGTEFGFDDFDTTHEMLRFDWICQGKPWWSTAIPPDKPQPSIIRRLKDYVQFAGTDDAYMAMKDAITEIERLQVYEAHWMWTKDPGNKAVEGIITSTADDKIDP